MKGRFWKRVSKADLCCQMGFLTQLRLRATLPSIRPSGITVPSFKQSLILGQGGWEGGEFMLQVDQG